MVGQALGMSRRTVDENIRRYIQEEKQEILKRGKPHPKWDDEMKDYAIKMVEDVDTLGGGARAHTVFAQESLGKTNWRIQQHFGGQKPAVSVSTLAKKLDKELITWKVSAGSGAFGITINTAPFRWRSLILRPEIQWTPRASGRSGRCNLQMHCVTGTHHSSWTRPGTRCGRGHDGPGHEEGNGPMPRCTRRRVVEWMLFSRFHP